MVLGVMWAVTAAMLGFMLGRVSMYGQNSEAAGEAEDNSDAAAEEGMKRGRKGRNRRIMEDMRRWSVGSPVSGEVTACEEGEHSTIVIHPEGDKLQVKSPVCFQWEMRLCLSQNLGQNFIFRSVTQRMSWRCVIIVPE